MSSIMFTSNWILSPLLGLGVGQLYNSGEQETKLPAGENRRAERVDREASRTGRHSSGLTGKPSARAASFCSVAMLMFSRSDRTEPSPIATMQLPGWKPYSSP
jgi:hypothetical protein